jgi:squalene cyclase
LTTLLPRDGDGPVRSSRCVRAKPNFSEAIRRGREWVLGLQSTNGGWGAFDADNTSEYLNHIPFADHGALLDPPTADVTARCVSMIAQLGAAADAPALAKRSRSSGEIRKRTAVGTDAGE